jgi:hypothetical protein
MNGVVTTSTSKIIRISHQEKHIFPIPDTDWEVVVSTKAERPVEDHNLSNDKSMNQRVVRLVRIKTRESFVCKNWSYDFTSIKTAKDEVTAYEKTETLPTTYEIEVEMLPSGITNYKTYPHEYIAHNILHKLFSLVQYASREE